MKKLIYNNDLENLSLITINEFFTSIRLIGKNQNKIFIGLSGGTSLNEFYKNINNLAKILEKEYWEKIIFCFVDERIIDLENKDSNFFQLSNTFLNDLIFKNFIKKKQIITIDFNSQNIEKDYSSKIKKIDILLLGTGPDSHICSLFPNHNLLENDSNNFLLIKDSPKFPKKRITISKKMIMNAQFSFIFFIEKSKQNAYDMFNDLNLDYKNCPAKLSLNSKNTFIVTNLK